jgi:phage baseplate assembly protein W
MTKSELNRDLKLKIERADNGFFKTDLSVSRSGDLESVEGRDNVIQAIRNRLATSRGELAEVGHPEYGSVLDAVIGEPNTPDTHRVIESLVRDCLGKETRIETILKVSVTGNRNDLNSVEILVYLKLRGDPDQLKLVLPFYLEGRL